MASWRCKARIRWLPPVAPFKIRVSLVSVSLISEANIPCMCWRSWMIVSETCACCKAGIELARASWHNLNLCERAVNSSWRWQRLCSSHSRLVLFHETPQCNQHLCYNCSTPSPPSHPQFWVDFDGCCCLKWSSRLSSQWKMLVVIKQNSDVEKC